MPPHPFTIRSRRAVRLGGEVETPYVPDTAPVVETPIAAPMSRVWLEWARAVTAMATQAASGGGAPDPHHATHEPGGSDPMAVDAAANVGSLRTLGTGANQAAAGTDPRFTNARPPTAHQATHQAAGADPVDVKLLAGYPGGTANFLRADGTFAAPPSGVPSAHHATHEPGGADALVALSASILTSGTLPDARLSANVARRDQANLFTQDQRFEKAVPFLRLVDTSAPVDARMFRVYSASSQIIIDSAPDNESSAVTVLVLSRAGDMTVGRDLTVTGAGGNVACKNQANTFTLNQTLSGTGAVLTFTDISAPADAKTFRLINTSQAFFIQAMNDAGGAVATPLTLNRQGDLVANRDFYEKGRATPIGHWIDVPYAAGNFLASPGTWTVDAADVGYNRYCLIGKTLFWYLRLNTTSMSSGAGNFIYMVIPGGFSCVGVAPMTAAIASDNGTLCDVQVQFFDATRVQLVNQTRAWSASTNNTQLLLTVIVHLA